LTPKAYAGCWLRWPPKALPHRQTSHRTYRRPDQRLHHRAAPLSGQYPYGGKGIASRVRANVKRSGVRGRPVWGSPGLREQWAVPGRRPTRGAVRRLGRSPSRSGR
jgi:hypothetical protein